MITDVKDEITIVAPYISKNPNMEVRYYSNLHAKIYVIDEIIASIQDELNISEEHK